MLCRRKIAHIAVQYISHRMANVTFDRKQIIFLSISGYDFMVESSASYSCLQEDTGSNPALATQAET